MKDSKIAKGLYIINLILFAFLGYLILSHKVFPETYRYGGLIGVGILQIVLGLFSFKKYAGKGAVVFLCLVLLVFIAAEGAGAYYLYRGMNVLEEITETPTEEEVSFSLIVLNTTDIETVHDLEEAKVLAALSRDKEKIEEYRDEFKEKEKIELHLKDCNTYMEGAKALLDKKEDVFLLNEAHRKAIENEYPQFKSRTRVLHTKNLLLEKEEEEPVEEVEEDESFNVYITGLDSYGSLNTEGLSDVNLVVTVNPKTHELLLTTIPRDTYVRIPGEGANEKDKLTHSGLYGAETSRKTVENFLDIDIPYYAKINFSSLIDMVDALGGITVENDYGFPTLDDKYYFPAGTVELDGQRALAFARERYNLYDGDLGRGRNHTKIIAAMIDKALTPQILFNYNEILGVMLEAADTNMPKDKIVELINQQIADNRGWEIETTQITGTGSTGELPSYYMPDNALFMMDPDPESVRQVRSEIIDMMEKEERSKNTEDDGATERNGNIGDDGTEDWEE